MIYEIPLDSTEAKFSQRVSIDNVIFNLLFNFNNRLNTWVFELQDSQNTPLYKGIVRPNIDYIKKIKSVNMPKGRLFFVSLESTEATPGRDDLGGSVSLMYDDEVA